MSKTRFSKKERIYLICKNYCQPSPYSPQSWLTNTIPVGQLGRRVTRSKLTPRGWPSLSSPAYKAV